VIQAAELVHKTGMVAVVVLDYLGIMGKTGPSGLGPVGAGPEHRE
jgi:hypothetical protein